MSRLNGIAVRIALASLTVALAAMAVMAIGVLVIGGQTFGELMIALGVDVSSSESMFLGSVGRVVVVSVIVAVALAIVLALVVGRRFARPLREASEAARRVAEGDLEVRLSRAGPTEMRALAGSIDQMAATLADQRERRDRFIRDAAHELRTPLANLQGYLEALRDGVIAPDEAQFGSLLEETARLDRLARSLDTLAQGDAGNALRPRPVDLVAQARTALGLVEPMLRARGVSVALDAPPMLPTVVDPDALAQVLGNLLSNATRHAGPDGWVRVRVATDPVGARVAVTNTGTGIPEADLAHVFERFYRVDPSRSAATGGAGIGLSIVAQLVAAWGGQVHAESSEAVTTFWFTIPA